MSSSTKKRSSKEISDEGTNKKKHKVEKSHPKEYVKLPSDWIMLNGVVLYEKQDIDVVRSYMNSNLKVNGHSHDFAATKNFTMTAQLMTNVPESVLGVIARNNVKAKFDDGLAAEKFAFANTFKRIEQRKPIKFDD